MTPGTIDDTLFALRHSEEEAAAKLKAKQLNLPYVSLLGQRLDQRLLSTVPLAQRIQLRLIPFAKNATSLSVATDQPTAETVKTFLATSQQSGRPVNLFVASKSGVDYALTQSNQPDTTAPANRQASSLQTVSNLAELKERISSVPTTELLGLLLSAALGADASDLHLEPQPKSLRLRFRIDGLLQDVVELPLSAHKVLVSRIKNLAHLKLDLTTAPQDGSFAAPGLGEPVDIRVSTLPSAYGETVVLRLLRQTAATRTLDQLNLQKEQLQIIRAAISQPNGLVIVTGPTGSGKTTTLYAAIAERNQSGVKIITLEDPIEYRLTGIEQSEVNSESGYTFATGLRAVLRQDPDIILVGEIRDGETASIALNAALTGHLVLTTLHTNDATAAFSRLIDLGVKSFLLSGSINLITAQRLIRRLCQSCRESHTPDQKEIALITQILPNSPLPSILFRAKGCPICNHTGYKGRIMILELLVPTPELEKLATSNGTLKELRQLAIKQGLITLEQDGIRRVVAGETTFDELWRVTKE